MRQYLKEIVDIGTKYAVIFKGLPNNKETLSIRKYNDEDLGDFDEMVKDYEFESYSNSGMPRFKLKD